MLNTKRMNNVMSDMKHARYSCAAFTLLELVLVILVVGIIATFAGRFLNANMSVRRLEATVEEMLQIRRGFVGDHNIVKGSRRVDFGYIGTTGEIPPKQDGTNLPRPTHLDFSDLFPNTSAATDDYREDAWHTRYYYDDDDGGGFMLIKSYGADHVANGGGFNQDIDMYIRRDLYRNNTVVIQVHDCRGVLLKDQGAGGGANPPLMWVDLVGTRTRTNRNYHQAVAQFGNYPTTWRITGVWVGEYEAQVDIRDANNWRDALVIDPVEGGYTDYVTNIVVYPQGPNRAQVYIVRLPGAVDPSQFP